MTCASVSSHVWARLEQTKEGTQVPIQCHPWEVMEKSFDPSGPASSSTRSQPVVVRVPDELEISLGETHMEALHVPPTTEQAARYDYYHGAQRRTRRYTKRTAFQAGNQGG